MNKPLHKDPSFWIVVVIVGVAVNVLQLNYGLPWFRQKLALMRPAPRVEPDRPRNSVADANLDTRKKTYSWQTPRFTPDIIEGAPSQVVLIPSEYQPPSGGWGSSRPDGAIGIRMAAESVVQSAYGWPSRSRMVVADPLPPGQFDFIAKQPSGALEALQAEIKKQWGVVAQREQRQTNVLILKLDHRDAPGLKPGTQGRSQLNSPGGFRLQNVPISVLSSQLENWSQLPVVDQTGLTERYNIEMPASVMNSFRASTGQLENLKALFVKELGLDLVQTNAIVEMLVVRKVK